MSRHSSNHDEDKTGKRMCNCSHKRQEHEIHPDEHCYKCGCKKFVQARCEELISKSNYLGPIANTRQCRNKAAGKTKHGFKCRLHLKD